MDLGICACRPGLSSRQSIFRAGHADPLDDRPRSGLHPDESLHRLCRQCEPRLPDRFDETDARPDADVFPQQRFNGGFSDERECDVFQTSRRPDHLRPDARRRNVRIRHGPFFLLCNRRADRPAFGAAEGFDDAGVLLSWGLPRVPGSAFGFLGPEFLVYHAHRKKLLRRRISAGSFPVGRSARLSRRNPFDGTVLRNCGRAVLPL